MTWSFVSHFRFWFARAAKYCSKIFNRASINNNWVIKLTYSAQLKMFFLFVKLWLNHPMIWNKKKLLFDLTFFVCQLRRLHLFAEFRWRNWRKKIVQTFHDFCCKFGCCYCCCCMQFAYLFVREQSILYRIGFDELLACLVSF